MPSWYTSLLNLLDGYDFVFCWKLVITYNVSEMLYLCILFFSRLLFMDVAAGLKILELIIPTPQLWVPQVFAAFMTIFHNVNLVGHLMIENYFYVNIKRVLRHCIDRIIGKKNFDIWELLRIVSQCKYHSVNAFLTFSTQHWS